MIFLQQVEEEAEEGVEVEVAPLEETEVYFNIITLSHVQVEEEAQIFLHQHLLPNRTLVHLAYVEFRPQFVQFERKVQTKAGNLWDVQKRWVMEAGVIFSSGFKNLVYIVILLLLYGL